MPVNKKVKDALRMDSLSLPESLRVLNITAEDYVDWSGDEALRVSVLLPEDLDDDALTGEAVIKLKSAIRQSIRAHGIQLFPYVFLMKPSDLLALQNGK